MGQDEQKNGKAKGDRIEPGVYLQILHDLLKHIATLDTGAIVLMSAFLDKSKSYEWRFVLALSFVSFIGSIAGIVWCHTEILSYVMNVEASERKEKCMDFALNWLGLGGFFVGLLLLTVFGVRNLR